jgi:hypothetical protein
MKARESWGKHGTLAYRKLAERCQEPPEHWGWALARILLYGGLVLGWGVLFFYLGWYAFK